MSQISLPMYSTTRQSDLLSQQEKPKTTKEGVALIDESWIPFITPNILFQIRLVKLMLQFVFAVQGIFFTQTATAFFVSMKYFTIWNENLALLVTMMIVLPRKKSKFMSEIIATLQCTSAGSLIFVGIFFWALLFHPDGTDLYDEILGTFQHAVILIFMLTDYLMHKEGSMPISIAFGFIFFASYSVFSAIYVQLFKTKIYPTDILVNNYGDCKYLSIISYSQILNISQWDLV